MNKDLYCLVLETLLKEVELNEFSSMGGGAVGVSAVPLGADSSGDVVYKDEKSNDKKHRSKKKKKSFLNKSPQYYLKNGPAKTRNRTFKNK